MSKKKAKPSKGMVRVPDLRFVTQIHKVDAKVVASEGLLLLQPTSGKSGPYMMPSGVYVEPEYRDNIFEIIVRDISNEVILEPGEDDAYEEDSSSDDAVIVIDNCSQVEELLSERKAEIFYKDSNKFSALLAGMTLSLVSYYLLGHGFPYPLITIAGIPAGILVAVMGGVVPIVRLCKRLRTTVICDGYGNYIDVETGKSNLNGGMKLPVRKGDRAWVS